MRRLLSLSLALVGLILLSVQADAVQIRDRCYMNTATVGTGIITLGTAESGYQTFAGCGVTDGQVVRYVIQDGAAYETGSGTYTTAGTTLSRTVSESSNADAAISLSGTAKVFITALTVDIPSETTAIDSAFIAGTDYYFILEGGVLKRALIPAPNVQTMTATGSGDSWDKPTGGQSMCRVELWGAGGSGGKGAAAAAPGGGGGGAYRFHVFRMAELGATETVSIATGGTSQTVASTAGNVGGNTTFGSGATLVTAYGGGGGGNGATGSGGGGGGGATAAGGSTAALGGGTTDGTQSFSPYGTPGGTGVATGNAATPGGSFMGGAGGGGSTGDATGTNAPGGASAYAGGGGGAGAEDVGPGPGAGGVSVFGGNGGAGAFDASNATGGTQPGGGGGGAETGNSGAGGNGKAVITCW